MEKIEKLKDIIDKIKGKGYVIDVLDRRPVHQTIDLGTLQSVYNSELKNLQASLSYLVFYKSDSLDVSLDNFTVYLRKIERLEYLREHGEFPNEILDIAAYILKDKNHL